MSSLTKIALFKWALSFMDCSCTKSKFLLKQKGFVEVGEKEREIEKERERNDNREQQTSDATAHVGCHSKM